MKSNILRFAKSKFFSFCIVGSIALAYVYPEIGSKGGVIKPEITVKYVALSLIFFISGLSLRIEDLAAAAWQCHLHLFIQCFTMVFIPLVTQLLVLCLGEFYSNSDLLMGLITVSCMPPPVSSAVILTKAVGGNEAAAVFNSALGSFLGIIVTPGLLFVFLGHSASVPFWRAISELSLTVILPVFVGQCFRLFGGTYLIRRKSRLSAVGSFLLLLIIFTTFCDAFTQNNALLEFSTMLITIVIVISLQGILMHIVFIVTTFLPLHFTPDDTVAAIFCATHKSLTLGIPMLKILYGDEQKFLLISFPLLVYHPMQILLGSLLVPFLQKWLAEAKTRCRRRLYPI